MKTQTCLHSPDRTCNGGMNSCVMCPKIPPSHFRNFWIGLALAILFLFLCTRCDSKFDNSGLYDVQTDAKGNRFAVITYQCTDTIYFLKYSEYDTIHVKFSPGYSLIDSVAVRKVPIIDTSFSGFALYDSLK